MEGLWRIEQQSIKMMAMFKALHQRDHIDYIFQENKSEEGSSPSKIAGMYQYKDSMTKLKSQRKTNSTDNIRKIKNIGKKKKNKNEEKNNMDISCDKLVKSHTRRSLYGMESLKEKRNLF